MTESNDNTAEIATATGLDEEHVERMLARAEANLPYRINLSAALRTYHELGDNAMLRVLARDVVPREERRNGYPWGLDETP